MGQCELKNAQSVLGEKEKENAKPTSTNIFLFFKAIKWGKIIQENI